MNNIQTAFDIENVKLFAKGVNGDCHNNSGIIARALRDQGFDVKLVSGFYVNEPKVIKHSWIEFEDKILETDIKQLREDYDQLPNVPFAVLDKAKFSHRYRGEENE